MKINKFDKFLNEAIREDEHSYLNDNLYNGESPEDEDGYHDQSEDTYDEDMTDLIDLFKRLFHNSGVENVEIEGIPDEIEMYFTLNYRERLRDMVKIFEVLSKISKDILPQFDNETDLWVDRSGNPLLTVTFVVNNSLRDSIPF